MFWKKKTKNKLRLENYVPLLLYVIYVSVFKKVLQERKNADSKWANEVFTGALTSETFIIACIIGMKRPDILSDVFKQDLLKEARDGWDRLFSIMSLDNFDLNRAAWSMSGQAKEVLLKTDLIKGLNKEALKSLAIPFLFGYIFGHDHPQVLLDTLEKKIQNAFSEGPYHFVISFCCFYNPLLNENDRRFLKDFKGGELDRSYKDGTLAKRLVSIYQTVASELVISYEQQSFGSLIRKYLSLLD